MPLDVRFLISPLVVLNFPYVVLRLNLNDTGKIYSRRVWRYHWGNQNLYTEEQTTQWQKEKVQKDKQRSTKHTHKTKDRETRIPLRTEGELGCSGRVSTSCSTSGTGPVNLVTRPVISHEWGKCLRQVEHIRCHLWHGYSITVNQVTK